jgi:hypothetical protein
MKCEERGPLVAHAPFARPGAKCAHLLEDTCARRTKTRRLAAGTVVLRLS